MFRHICTVLGQFMQEFQAACDFSKFYHVVFIIGIYMYMQVSRDFQHFQNSSHSIREYSF